MSRTRRPNPATFSRLSSGIELQRNSQLCFCFAPDKASLEELVLDLLNVSFVDGAGWAGERDAGRHFRGGQFDGGETRTGDKFSGRRRGRSPSRYTELRGVSKLQRRTDI